MLGGTWAGRYVWWSVSIGGIKPIATSLILKEGCLKVQLKRTAGSITITTFTFRLSCSNLRNAHTVR
jgi:hypothetical protein